MSYSYVFLYTCFILTGFFSNEIISIYVSHVRMQFINKVRLLIDRVLIFMHLLECYGKVTQRSLFFDLYINYLPTYRLTPPYMETQTD